MSKKTEAIVSSAGFFLSLVTSLVDKVKELGGSIEDIHRLVTPEGAGTLSEIARIIIEAGGKTKESFLRLISGEETITIDATDGTEVLADADDVFAYVDSDFKNWGANETGGATKEALVEVHEMTKDATFSQMFTSLSRSDDVTKLCLTQGQIKSFVKNNRKWIRTDGYGTFFLFQSKGEIFVARVYCSSDGALYVNAGRFEYSDVWGADYCHRIVVPQLA